LRDKLQLSTDPTERWHALEPILIRAIRAHTLLVRRTEERIEQLITAREQLAGRPPKVERALSYKQRSESTVRPLLLAGGNR